MTLFTTKYYVTNFPSKIEGDGGSMTNSNTIVVEEVPLRGTLPNRCLSPSCEGLRPSCMVLIMNSFFEAFDLFEVAPHSFALPQSRENLLLLLSQLTIET